MRRSERKRNTLLKKLARHPEFVRGSISSVCATCNRARCICERKSTLRAYRLTYKDGQQKTKIVYVPRDELPRMRRMIASYQRLRAIVEQLIETNLEVFKEETRS